MYVCLQPCIHLLKPTVQRTLCWMMGTQRFKKFLDLKGFHRQPQGTITCAIHSTSIVARLHVYEQKSKQDRHRPYFHGAQSLVYETGKSEGFRKPFWESRGKRESWELPGAGDVCAESWRMSRRWPGKGRSKEKVLQAEWGLRKQDAFGALWFSISILGLQRILNRKLSKSLENSSLCLWCNHGVGKGAWDPEALWAAKASGHSSW